LLKLYCQRHARLDQPERAPDSHRGRRSSNLSRWCIYSASFSRRNSRQATKLPAQVWFTEPQVRAAGSLLSLGAYRNVICIRLYPLLPEVDFSNPVPKQPKKRTLNPVDFQTSRKGLRAESLSFRARFGYFRCDSRREEFRQNRTLELRHFARIVQSVDSPQVQLTR
jgi:hypothetical protein